MPPNMCFALLKVISQQSLLLGYVQIQSLKTQSQEHQRTNAHCTGQCGTLWHQRCPTESQSGHSSPVRHAGVFYNHG